MRVQSSIISHMATSRVMGKRISQFAFGQTLSTVATLNMVWSDSLTADLSPLLRGVVGVAVEQGGLSVLVVDGCAAVHAQA